MPGHAQFCPIAKAAELFCERWNALVIRNLAAGAQRFGDIQRGVPHMSPTLLSRRLKQLEEEGIVARTRAPGGGHWLYRLTDAGAEFVPLVAALGVWGRRWTRRTLKEGELDLGLLIWGLEHCVDPQVYAPGRTLVQLTVTDQPAHKAVYWFLNEDGAKDLCVSHPGGEVHLYLAATLRDLIHIYRGDIRVAGAIEQDRLEVLGARKHVRRLEAWLNLGPLAGVTPAAGAPAEGLSPRAAGC